MSAYPGFIEVSTGTQHALQLYGNDDRSLISHVSRYLTEGLSQGDGMLVVATLDHVAALARTLAQDGGYHEAVQTGRLVFLDAKMTLDKCLAGGGPQWDRFKRVIGSAIQIVQQRVGNANVRAYGEMADLLWRTQQYAAAVLLEEYCNRLLASTDCRLFCAYPIDIFSDDFERAAVAPLLCTHTHVLLVSDAQERAVERAVHEVLGPKAQTLELSLALADARVGGAVMPRALAAILLVKDQFPSEADQVLRLARRYCRT